MSSMVGAPPFKVSKIRESSVKKITNLIIRDRIHEPTGLAPNYFKFNDIKYLYVARVDGKIVGWSFQALKSNLVAVYVKPEFRCKGIGKALLSKLYKKLDDKHYQIKPFSYTQEAIYKITKEMSNIDVW